VKRYGSGSQQTIKQALYSFAVDVIPVDKPKQSQNSEEQEIMAAVT